MYYKDLTRYYFHPEKELYFLDVSLQFRKTQEPGIHLFFVPNRHCTPDEDLKLKLARTASEQKKIYDTLSYCKTFLHEGCRFGIDYAYKEYLAENKTELSFAVHINVTNYYEKATHELAAYCSMNAFWQAFDFTPKSENYYDVEKRRFFFENAPKFPIGQKTKKDAKKLFNEEEIEFIGKVFNEMIENKEHAYFSR